MLRWHNAYPPVPFLQVMGVIRQSFQDATRFLNGLSAWLLSFFQRDYRETLRRSWQDNPWHSWWHQAQARPSTLNALIAAMQQQEAPHVAAPGQGPEGRTRIPHQHYSRFKQGAVLLFIQDVLLT